ncbi:MAG: Ig domain-containing protein, partial [Burkholderiaceae bacterium]|nr:Ig domain-containing protein [Burkholderiaceae bacterium]
PDRSYPSNDLFAQATLQLPGFVAPAQPGDLQTVLAPLQIRGWGSGFAASAGDIGALAMVELADGSVLASGGTARNEVFHFDEDGGRSTSPLFTLDAAVLDMAIDALGQLWVMTGSELLQVDANSGGVIARHKGPGQDPLTHAVAIDLTSGLLYVASGNGVEIFDPTEEDAALAWRHFSNTRVGDLAFGPDGRLWGVRWTGTEVNGAVPDAGTEIISFPMTGRSAGRAEVEYRLAGLVDSIAFGRDDTVLTGLLLASSNVAQRPVIAQGTDVPHQAAVWMIELQTRRSLQVASGGTRGEALLTTADGRVLVAQSAHIDEIAPIRAPLVVATSVQDGALVPLPLTQIAVSFDQAMWLGTDGADSTDLSSVLNPANYVLTTTTAGSDLTLQPQAARWDAATRSAVLTLPNLPAGGWRLEVTPQIRSAAQVRLAEAYVVVFTAVADLSHMVRLSFADTRADRLIGQVSYDVSVTNIGADDLRGPLMLLLDPGRYFGADIVGADQGTGEQAQLWVIDLNAGLQALGGRLSAGQTLDKQTVSVHTAGLFDVAPGTSNLAKFNLGHGIYAVPFDNTPPTLVIADAIDLEANVLPAATAGQSWSATLQATDSDGTLFFWELVQAPAGLVLTQDDLVESGATGYGNRAVLSWTPSARDRADSEVLVRVIDSRGGVALRRFSLPVGGGNHVPVVDPVFAQTLAEGQSLVLPILAADADGDTVTVTLRNVPAGARYDAGTGLLTWTPGYDQAGRYTDVTVVASDGKHTVMQRFDITVEQGYAKPVLGALPTQTLREGERFALQLPGSIPGDLAQVAATANQFRQADGSTVTLEYSSPWLPGGATLNSETGWFEWTPGYSQASTMRLPITLSATYTPADGEAPVTTSVSRELVLDVLNANGAPQFDPVETWNVLEGQPLRISVFAFDPDNPGFAPKLRLSPQGPATDEEGSTPASVSYQVTGLPAGASFDEETLELVWTPGYTQAGTYQVTVTATDDGNGTGTPATSQITLPIVVSNANLAPVIGDIESAIVDRGAVLEIPVNALDADGNPLTVTLHGLPSFASYEQTTNAAGDNVNGVIRFAPGAGHRGDYTITVVAQDDGGGNVNQVATQAKSFALTVRSFSEAPEITVAPQVVAVAGQKVIIPLRVSDLDQDALHYAAQGLPQGASIEVDAQYGRASIRWTPTAAQIGVYDISLEVTDSGLPPANAGFVVDPNNPPLPSTTVRDLRIIVRDSNLAPELIAVAASGAVIEGDSLSGSKTIVAGDEGVPLTLELSARDDDLDFTHWSVQGLPTGMVLEPVAGSDGQSLLRLRWTPGLFAAQNDTNNGATPGLYQLTVTAGDGSATVTRDIELTVRNTNQAPRLLPVPLQLAQEGQTLAFTILAADADNEPARLALLFDDNTPAGVNFDANTGFFEWTPSADVVDNATGDNQAFSFNFSASDGSATTTREVQVRVFDVNRVPEITAASHALIVGQSFSLDIIKGKSNDAGALQVSDADGQAQTDDLVVSFANLPEGAVYDADAGRLIWTPGPGQLGDVAIMANVSDGRNAVGRSFTLRVVADNAANEPRILINTTPSTPVLPDQTVLTTVRAESFSPIAQMLVEMRGSAAEKDDWTELALDGAGRVRLSPTAPGLIELRVTATDADGFTGTQTQTVRVRDPLDTAAPELQWGGALGPASTGGAPAEVTQPTLLQARVSDTQLMGWVLEAAPATGGQVSDNAWRLLAEAAYAAEGRNGLIDLTTLDPSTWANGVYLLRLRAWDLTGRTTEITSRVLVDSTTKSLTQASATDALFQLGDHAFALTRTLPTFTPSPASAGEGRGEGNSGGADFGNWILPLLDTQLTHDQGGFDALGLAQPWAEGARVWLQVPASLSQPNAAAQYLSFTLGTTSQALGSQETAPTALHPVFEESQGWALRALGDEGQAPTVQRQGQRLLDRSSGLPWVPAGYELTAADGTRYLLDASGEVQSVHFADGQQWLVSDAGVALVGATDVSQRIEFVRSEQGGIERVSGPQADGSAQAVIYRYDAQGRLALARDLFKGQTLAMSG